MRKKSYSPDDLVIGGYTPLTTIDYPGELAAVLFLQGCPWRCGYCQNADLLPRRQAARMSWSQVRQHLESRRGLVDAVVFSGGEPTIQKALPAAIDAVHELGYKAGLHSAGVCPDRLRSLLPRIDWIGLDVKALPEDYAAVTGGSRSAARRAWDSVDEVLDSGVRHEFRTTLHPLLLDDERLLALGQRLAERGARRFVIQDCVLKNSLDPALRPLAPYRPSSSLLQALEALFPAFEYRRA